MAKLFFSILILMGGAGFALLYLRKPPVDSRRLAIGGDRPWRRLGAGILLVLSIMFVLGIYVVDIPDNPRMYAAFWLVMLGMVFWLCGLAVRDVLYTRQVMSDWRAGRAHLDGTPIQPEEDPENA